VAQEARKLEGKAGDPHTKSSLAVFESVLQILSLIVFQQAKDAI
jgi:hypothetical protein